MVDLECGGKNFNSSKLPKKLHMKSQECLRVNNRPSDCEMTGGGCLGVVSMGIGWVNGLGVLPWLLFRSLTTGLHLHL